jgi:hypothetical protein
MNEVPQAKPEPVGLEKKSYFQRVVGMFTSPGETFKYLDEKPDLIPALSVPIIGTILVAVASTIIGIRSPQFEESMSKMPESMTNVMKYGAPIIGAIFGVIFVLIMLLIKTGIVHVIAPFLNGKASFKKLVCILGYSTAPGLIFGALSVLYIFLNPNDYIPFTGSLGMIFTKEKVGLFWYSFYTSIDLFSFWSLGLTIIGVAIIYKFSWKKAAVILLSLWLIGVGLGLGLVKVFEPFYNKSQQVQEEDNTE